MSEIKFKVGDLVYCQTINNKISKITKESEGGTVFLSNAGWFKNTGLNHNDMPVICHATQENYELLSKLYPNFTFEPPPKHKEPREIIKAMLESGYAYVACRVGDYKEDFDYVSLIHCIDDKNSYPFIGDSEWRYANPFDPKTGKTIIDFVDGEVVLESEND